MREYRPHAISLVRTPTTINGLSPAPSSFGRKSQTTKEKDVDALTFMRTVVMSFVRGMECGEQTLPTNDLFVYLPVQILPDLVTAMEQQDFKPAEMKGSSGYPSPVWAAPVP